MPKKSKVYETDLYQPVKEYLEGQGFLVRGEVQGCDVVASKAEELVVVELKLSVTTSLLVQAVDRQRLTDAVYIAVPKPSSREWKTRWRGLQQLLRRLELGLMLVSFNTKPSTVEVVFQPTPYPRRKARRRAQAIIREVTARSGDYNVGGSTRRKLMTAYRENALQIAACLEDGPLPTKALRKLGTGDKTRPILADNHYGWFRRVERGVYELTSVGRSALEEHVQLVRQLRAAMVQGDV